MEIEITVTVDWRIDEYDLEVLEQLLREESIRIIEQRSDDKRKVIDLICEATKGNNRSIYKKKIEEHLQVLGSLKWLKEIA